MHPSEVQICLWEGGTQGASRVLFAFWGATGGTMDKAENKAGMSALIDASLNIKTRPAQQPTFSDSWSALPVEAVATKLVPRTREGYLKAGRAAGENGNCITIRFWCRHDNKHDLRTCIPKLNATGQPSWQSPGGPQCEQNISA